MISSQGPPNKKIARAGGERFTRKKASYFNKALREHTGLFEQSPIKRESQALHSVLIPRTSSNKRSKLET